MPRRLTLLNAALIGIAILSVGYVIRELRAPKPVSTRRAAPPAPTTAAPPATAPEAQAGGYNVVASRNLFSPTRSEAPVTGTASALPVSKPNVYGIILRDGASVAYLEDPTTKRVAGYRLGDSIAGGTVKNIGADHVVLNRPDGELNLRLRDPAKPRPPVPAATGQPGAPVTGLPVPGTPPIAGAPGAIAPGIAPMAPPTEPSLTPPAGPSGSPLPRRPVPPQLLRRLPPAAPSDAPPPR